MIAIDRKTKVGDVVSRHAPLADLFEKHHIDFCCGGAQTIEEACTGKNLEPDALIEEIKAAWTNREADPAQPRFNEMELDELSDYIVEKHHSYVAEAIPLVTEYLERTAHAHGDNHPELHQIKALFKASAGQLAQHMQKEEMVLFPRVKHLIRLKKTGQRLPVQPGAVASPIEVMMQEHAAEGERFEEIRRLSAHYTVPADACSTFQAAYRKLEEFELDLHRHIHLENNILFPKALALEKDS